MDLLVGPLLGWRLETRFEANGDRYHQQPSGSDCWRALEYLGKGSFGEVKQEECLSGPSKNAVRAVKCLSKRESDLAEIFRRELSALFTFSNSDTPEHKNYFVQGYGWFEDTEHIYITMEFLEHGDLGRYIKKPLPERDAALITAQVAQALQYMHREKFVHRDIKPQNILVSCLGPEWHVKVADFGIAKNVNGTNLDTLGMGTIGYTAPEQLWGDSSNPYTSAVDVWSLGAVAFRMVTGLPPFPTIPHLMKYARDHKTHFPIRLLGASSGFCMNFALGTMAEAPERRLTIEEVLAHDWLSMQLDVSQREKLGMDAADTQTNLSTLPSNAWLNTHSSHQPQPRPPSTPNLTAIYGKQKRHRETEKTGQKGADLGQKAVDYHNRGWLASGSDEGIVKIWDPAKGECIWTLEGHGDRITSVAWSHDGRLASASRDETIKIWDSATGKCIWTLKGHHNTVFTVAWSHDSSNLASGSDEGTVKIWDSATGKCISTLKGHDDTILTVGWSKDNTKLASGSANDTVKIWHLATGKCISTLKGDCGQVWSMAWGHKGRLASVSKDDTVKIWNPSTGQRLSMLKGHGDRITSVAWSHDGSRLASASLDETIKIWDPTTGECISTLKGGYGLCQWVWSVAWSHDDSRLALGSAWNAVGIWDLAADKPILQTLGLHQDTVKSLAWSHKQPAIG